MFDDDLVEQKAWLVILKASRTEFGNSGTAKKVTKGSFTAVYSTLQELEQEIRRVKNSIIIMEREIY